MVQDTGAFVPAVVITGRFNICRIFAAAVARNPRCRDCACTVVIFILSSARLAFATRRYILFVVIERTRSVVVVISKVFSSALVFVVRAYLFTVGFVVVRQFQLIRSSFIDFDSFAQAFVIVLAISKIPVCIEPYLHSNWSIGVEWG